MVIVMVCVNPTVTLVNVEGRGSCPFLLQGIKMDKRYQVFVSSTFTDLEEERKHVIQTLMEMDCIPAGMELFPAIDEEQWEFIKKVIDDCDYYLLIIGGRYGSVADDGLSYTEKEFDYAVSKGLRVIVLLHDNPESLPFAKSEKDAELREKLKAFTDKASKGRLRKTWSTAEELPGLVALSMSKTIKTYPAVGWIRANQASNESVLRELIDLQKDNESLRNQLNDIKSEKATISIQDLDDMDSVFEFKWIAHYSIMDYGSTSSRELTCHMTWKEIFSAISPFIIGICLERKVSSILGELVREKSQVESSSATINEHDLKTISIQLTAYNLVDVGIQKNSKSNNIEYVWSLTEKGKKEMLSLRTIRKK